MPYNFLHQKSTIDRTIKFVEDSIFIHLCELKTEVYVTPEPVPFSERMNGVRKDIKKGGVWGKVWDCGWFHFSGKVPCEAKGKKVVAYIDIHGEACVFDDNGFPLQGLTSGSSCFDVNLGNPKKREYVITECAEGGEIIDFWADAGCNDLFGFREDSGLVEYADISICRDNVKGLYYDMKVLYSLMSEMDENTARYHKILKCLFDASCLIRNMSDEEVDSARKVLAKELDKVNGDADLSISAIGHAHIDLAWLWPVRETKRKGVRTFSTALSNMEKYPDYIFGASQPQLYQWVKEEQPELFNKVKDCVKSGRWEPQGAMWVEADTNVSGGEALVRQILYGKKFFLDEFGKNMEILWLPDVFGYCGSLPQILKKSDVPYFLTIKLSWSQHNEHPHHTFKWRGIDGSEVLVHMPPEGEYNSMAYPESLKKIERRYLDKCVCDEAVMLFGIGDGGGGPGETHLEALKREKNLLGLPPVKQEYTSEFFHRLEKNDEQYKVFAGELYLEKHQGTYTTQARNKKYNRKMEYLLREAEYAGTVTGKKYPKEKLEQIWKEVLLYQFHDILPGSSIKRVYDESLERYRILYSETENMVKELYGNGNYVINSLSWERNEWINRDGKWFKVSVPPMGSVELKDGILAEKVENDDCLKLENNCVRVIFDDTGAIETIFDKEQNCQVLEKPSNKFAVYVDDGDGWDFSETYRDTVPEYFELNSVKSYTDGPMRAVVQEYVYGESKLIQTISVCDDSPLVVFDTKVDWKERNKMLRTAFYTNISTSEATCDIQYGNIKRPVHRNTSWDMAKYEVCAHKYVDLSDCRHGVSLINDCKYGHCVLDGMIDINLLRSPNHPGEFADMAEHSFKYAIYSHEGDVSHSDVIKKSYEFNIPMQYGDQIEPFVEVDNPDIIIESVKKAEDSDAVIIRMYETLGAPSTASLRFNKKVKKAYLTNLIETENMEVDLSSIEFRGFEIHTIKVFFE